MIKLRRLKVVKFRHVVPGTELRFDDGINLVHGDRATGKTTLLTLLSMVCRGSFAVEAADEPLDIEAELAIRGLTVVMHRVRERVDGEWVDRFDVATVPPQAGPPPIPSGWVWMTSKQYGGECPDLVSDLYNAFRFDESLAAFAALTGRAPAVPSPAAPRPASLVKQRYDGAPALHRDYVPPAYADLFWSDDACAPVFRRPLDATELPLARSVAELLDVPAVTVAPNFRWLASDPDELGCELAGVSVEVTRQGGAVVHHDRLAYGEQRLLAFAYYLACNPAVVLADELAAGLGERDVLACLAALGERQVFLAAADPTPLLRHLAAARLEARTIHCSRRCDHERELMVWRELSATDAPQPAGSAPHAGPRGAT